MTAYEVLMLCGCPTLSVALIGFLAGLLRRQMQSVQSVRRGVQALLRAQMIADWNKYGEQGYAPIYARENFENCWRQYHALGANGVMDDLHAKFLNLPDKPKEEPHEKP